MGDIHHNDLEVLVGGVLTDPVGIKDPETFQSTTHTLLGYGLEVSLGLLLFNSTRALGLTIGTTLCHGPLSASTSHGDTVDDEPLLGLVTQSASFVGSGGTRSSVNLGKLAILPAPDSEEIPHDVALLLAVQLGHVLVRTHPDSVTFLL